MRRLLLIGLALFAAGMLSAQAQTATDVNEGLRVTADASTGTQVLSWWGRSGRTYFVEQSYDLINWTYVPYVENGTDMVSGLNFTCTDSRQFWRLKYVTAGGGTAGAVDSDGDGISNDDELSVYQTDPLNPDSDGDGFSDGTEVLAGTDLKSATSNPETDLNDVPLLKTAFLLSGGGEIYYSASHGVLQSEYSATDWLVSEYGDIPGNTYGTSYVVNGSMPAVPALPARPDADSSINTWSDSYFYAGNAMTVTLARIVDADNSGPGFFTGNPVIGRRSLLVGNAAKYKLTVQFPSRNVRTVKLVEQKTIQPVTYDPATAGYAFSGSQTVTASQILTLTLPANATETAETILQPNEADENMMTTATVAEALFITPAGDPVTGPVDAGPNANTDPDNIPDGANEFTFSADTPGVLKLKLKVRKPGVVDQSATDQAKYTFDVDAIGGSVLTWGTDNTGGKAKVDGEYLTATAIFTGLPQNNTDFGTKTVRLKYDGNEVANTKFEVFFNAGINAPATNHPGNGAGSDPNWFYYWRQAAGAQNVNLVYGNASPDDSSAITLGMRNWDWNVAPDKTQIKFYDELVPGDEEYGANSGASIPDGIDAFFSTLLHEQRHVWQIANADALLGNLIAPNTPWQYGWSWNTDIQVGINTNHFTPGTDGLPGVPNYDDDYDATVDNLVIAGRGELGWWKALIKNPPPGLVETDDVALGMWPITPANHDWPAAWIAPLWPVDCISPLYLEWDAVNAALPHKQDQNAADDWGNPGKQHQTKKYND